MSARLDRLGEELHKARRRKAEWEAKVKELERKYKEEENTEIHDLVHAANLTPDQLAQLLQMISRTEPPFEAASSQEEDTPDEI